TGVEGRLPGSLHSAPARTHLHPRGRARESPRPARAAPQDPVSPLAGLAQNRPQLRFAAQEPTLPEARRFSEVAEAFFLASYSSLLTSRLTPSAPARTPPSPSDCAHPG